MLPLKIKPLRPGFKMPTKGTSDSGCWDIVMPEAGVLRPVVNTYPVGFAVEIPQGYEMLISMRSGWAKKSVVMVNAPAHIDADYRGEVVLILCLQMQLGAINTAISFAAGERLCQFELKKVVDLELVLTEELSATERGTGGLGSTGS